MSRELIPTLPLRGARVLHLSGITPALSRDCADLVDGLLDTARALDLAVSFDVNHRPQLWPSAAS
jgi:2-dehydro-3-deoxygluconokinase